MWEIAITSLWHFIAMRWLYFLIGPADSTKTLKKESKLLTIFILILIYRWIRFIKRSSKGNFWVLNPFFSYEHQLSGVQSKQAINWIVGEGIQAMVHTAHVRCRWYLWFWVHFKDNNYVLKIPFEKLCKKKSRKLSACSMDIALLIWHFGASSLQRQCLVSFRYVPGRL